MSSSSPGAYDLSLGEELRHFRCLVANYVDAALALHRRRGDAVRLRFPKPSLHLAHPRHVDHVLRHSTRYVKSEDYQTLRPILGDGIFVSEGDVWTRQRRLLSPEFRPAAISRYLPAISRDLQGLFDERWEPGVGSVPRDLAGDMMYLTIRVVGDAIFARDFREQADAIGHDLEICLDQATFRMLTGGLLPTWMPTPGNIRSLRAGRELDGIVGRLIETARASPEPSGHDMLSRLLQSTGQDGRPAMDDRQLLDEVKSLILAGHETTSLALTWAFYLLSLHHEVRRRLEAEVDAVLGGRLPGVDDLPRLVYTRMVFCEAMRLYPPVPAVTRRALEDDEMDGVQVQAGEKVILHVHTAQRHPDFWQRPDEFDPERFGPDRLDQIAPGAWVPFLVGRRACLGEHFAMLEGVVALAGIVSRYRLERTEEGPIGNRPISTLRLARPLMVRIHRRQPARA